MAGYSSYFTLLPREKYFPFQMKYLFVVSEYGYSIVKRGSKLREVVSVYLATLLSLLTRTT